MTNSFLSRAIGEHLGIKGVLTKLVARLMFVMALFTLCRLIFYWYNSALFPDVDSKGLLYMLWGGLKFDLSAVLYTNLLYILFFLIPHPWRYSRVPNLVMKYWFVFSNGLMLLLNCYDMVFYPFTLRRTTARIFEEFGNEGNLAKIAMNALGEHWPIVLVGMALLALLVIGYGKVHAREVGPKGWTYYLTGTVLMLVGAYLVVGGLRGGFLHSTRPITLSNAAKYVDDPSEMAIVINTPFAIFRTFGKATYTEKHYFANQDDLEKVYTPIHNAGGAPKGNFKYDNVVIFIVESFGREFIGKFNHELDNGGYEGYTPFMDSLLRKGKVYWNSFANGKKSIDAMPSVLASIPSIKTPYVLSHYSANHIEGIARLLGRKGYETAFFHGAPNGSMGFQSFANLAGFEHYYGKTEYGNDADYDGIWGIWDEKFFGYYADKINEMQSPFLTVLFSLSSHHPYQVPEGYEGKLKEGPTPLHKCINYTDNALRKFFEKAQTMPWFEHTLFVITADHTPALPSHDLYRTAAGVFRIPILFYHPKHPEWADHESNELIQQIDIMPSILGYLQYDEPYFAFGRNVFDKRSRPFVVNYLGNAYQYFSDEYMLQYDDANETAVALYDFKKDSLLRHNLLGKRPQEQAFMEEHVKAFIQQYNASLINDRMRPNRQLLHAANAQ